MRLLKILVALGLLWFVFFGSLPKIDLKPTPKPDDEVVSIIDIEKPSDEILKKVKPVADLINNSEDRAKLALFNYEFSKRVAGYNTDVQKLNDLYAKAGNNFFGDSIKGKYLGLANSIVNLFQSVVTDENHILTKEEKESLKELFSGLAWALIER